MKTVTHPNGLKTKIPEIFDAKPTKSGFLIEPAENENASSRNPLVINISLISKNHDLDEATKVKTRAIDGRKISYTVQKSEGGSGGETYSFEAFEHVHDKLIKYTQSTQSDLTEPDFSLMWKIIKNTNFKKSRIP